MLEILFTKKFPEEFFQKHFGPEYKIESYDFIQTEYTDIESVKDQIDTEIQYYIVSSERTAQRIRDLELTGEFFCVGDKSAKILYDSGKKVTFTAKTASELVDHIKHRYESSQSFLFFCSSIRRDEIPSGLKVSGHNVQEIVIYTTHSQEVKLPKIYDGYVFFSPSGVKSFASQFSIPEKAVIFAIGRTTANAVKEVIDRTAIFSELSDTQSLTALIKKHFNAEK